MKVDLAGKSIEMTGDLNDAYFKSLDANTIGLAGLASSVERIRNDALIFDVGANIGLSTIMLALTKPNSRVIAFEASPANINHLRINTAPFQNITVVGAAVSDRPGRLSFHSSPFTAGSHVVSISNASNNVENVEVPAIRLDDYSGRPDFIKIDVEGHEPEVLAGAQRILSEVLPWVYMEFNSWTLNVFGGHSPAAFASALWRTFNIEDAPADAISFLHKNIMESGCVSDLLFRPKPGVRIPTLPEMSYSPAAVAKLRTFENS